MASEPTYMVQAEITRAAFDSGPDAIVVVDSDGKIIAVNTQGEFLTGLPRADLIGSSVDNLVPQLKRDIHRDNRERFLRMPHRRLMAPDMEISIIQKSTGGRHSEVPVDVNLAPSIISIGPIVVATLRQKGGWESV